MSLDSTALLGRLFSSSRAPQSSPIKSGMTAWHELVNRLDRINSFAEYRGLPLVNDSFRPDPRTVPIKISDAALPPLLFFLALTLLFPSRNSHHPLVRVVRAALALASASTFVALPYRFHVPGSAILTYQLGLIGGYGCLRCLDLLIVSRTVPKRVKHVDGEAISLPATTSFTERKHGKGKEPRTKKPRTRHPSMSENIDHTSGIRSLVKFPHNAEHEVLEQDLFSRLTWAFDLMISMRGVGWDFCSSDVRHTSRSWHPPPVDRINALVLYILPSLLGALSVMKHIYNAIEEVAKSKDQNGNVQEMGYSLQWLPLPLQLLGVASCGISLYCLFDASYTIASVILGYTMHYLRSDLTQASSTNNIASMPPLNPLPATEATSIRAFWSRCWHRLFARMFYTWGVRPLSAAQVYMGKVLGIDTNGDIGKVVGAFAVSAVVHGQGERAALGARSSRLYNHRGIILPLGGEPLFFLLSAVGIIIEGSIREMVLGMRRRPVRDRGHSEAAELERWYDKPVGAVWTVSWLLWSGTYFIEGWVSSGIVAELTFSSLRWNM